MYVSGVLSFLTVLFFLLACSLIFILTKKNEIKRRKKLFIFSNFEALSPLRIIKSIKGSFFILFLLGSILFALALARPQERSLESRISDKGIDILFVLDISDSMLIEDMSPHKNRLESAKHHIKKFVENRPSDRMGLVVFSGEAYTRVPLTVDHSLLLENLNGLHVSEHIKKGTAIGVALGAAINRIRDSLSKTKIVVLLTDGENNTGVIDPLTALELAVDEESKVYTVGMGKNGQSMLPIFRRDRNGRKVKSYRPFPTQINEDLLQKISNETGGEFYRASKESDMSDIFSSIDELEKSDFELPKTYKVIEKFQFLLLMSFLCFFSLVIIEVLFFWRGY